jgi:hypothetical protein
MVYQSTCLKEIKKPRANLRTDEHLDEFENSVPPTYEAAVTTVTP